MENKNWVAIIGGILTIIVLVGLGFYFSRSNEDEGTKPTIVSNFEDCVAAGYPAMESYPRQCRTPDGKTFIENIPSADNASRQAGGCYIGGCSNQICSEDPNAVSTCEYKEEYACYSSARCERQPDGECGWTETTALFSCLSKATDFNYESLVK